VEAANVRVTIQNLAPVNGTFQTPVWVGFHDGAFDLYDQGAPASMALERIAEDGNTGPLNDAFSAAQPSGAQSVVPGPGGPFAPSDMASMDFNLDGMSGNQRYFSYASMVIPSNDAFVANGNPLAFEIFDAAGNFLGADILVLGSQILDAGTEVNDELPMNTAFLGQMTPDTGVDENGTVQLHPGFLMIDGGILDDPMFANADFTAPGYQALRITISAVPDGGSAFGLLGIACATLAGFRGIRARR
jgi:hypothetical protein